MDYNVAMTPKEETNITRKRKARYFITVMLLYMAICLCFYLLISLVHAIVYLKPLIRIILFIISFVLAEIILRKVMSYPLIIEIAGIETKKP